MEDGGLFGAERRPVASEVFRGYLTLDAGIRRAGQTPSAMGRA